MADSGLIYPLTKMNFIVEAGDGVAAFTEVSGVEASVDVVEFRQGNSNSLAPVKIPGLVKHGNVTLKYGCTLNNKFLEWAAKCVSEIRGAEDIKREVKIELMDLSAGAPKDIQDKTSGSCVWILKNAWVMKYSAPDLNSTASEAAVESVELAYEELTIPGQTA
ncbi:phage tail protein [Mediterraneibacter agrestimuris]|uniref:phage tail protein n=1 Tax=Mediterraneibacter agrestimuris TaxID=2941333 RepID=UPI00203E1B13|nr:phage tail protein [Mediterraneibacter agrestimuris]